MPTDTIYTPDAPVVAGDRLTVDAMLTSPLRLQRRVATMVNERLIASRVFANGAPATGGAVIFDRVIAGAQGDLYTGRDVQAIEPMSEFPILNDSDTSPAVARAIKWGGAFEVSYEEKRRNQVDVVNRKLTRLANTIVRKVDAVALATLDSDDVVKATTMTGTKWADAAAGNPVMDIATAVSTIASRDLGYAADTVLINPAQELALFGRKDVRDALPREAPAANPYLTGKVNGLLSLTWITSNRVPAGTAYVLNAGMVGSLHDEVPFYTRVTDQPRNESYLLQGARVTVPVVTDPLAVVKLTGLA